MRFRRVAASVAAAACAASSPALAADACASLKSYKPEVETAVNSPEPTLRNDIPYAKLKTIPGATRASLLGLTQFIRGVNDGFELETVASPDGDGVCAALREVRLTIVHTTLAIYIADHVHPGSCTYDVTMAHEREHVAYERGALRKALLEFSRKIERPTAWFHGDDEADARKTARRRIGKWSRQLLARASKVARRGHAYLDVPSNIRGSLAKCPRWQRR